MKDWSLNAKISSVFAILLVTCVGITALALNKMNDLNESLNGIVAGPADRIVRANDLKSLFLLQVINSKNFILEQSKEGMNKIGESIKGVEKELEEKCAAYVKVARPEAMVKLEAFKAALDDFNGLNEKIMELSLADRNKEATELSIGAARASRAKAEAAINDLVKFNKDMMESESVRTDVEYASARLLMILSSVLATAAALAIAWLVHRSLNRAIDQVIANLTDNSNQVTSAAQQIASSSEELSQATTQ